MNTDSIQIFQIFKKLCISWLLITKTKGLLPGYHSIKNPKWKSISSFACLRDLISAIDVFPILANLLQSIFNPDPDPDY